MNRVFLLSLIAVAAAAIPAAPALAVPAGCEANPECLIESVSGPSGADAAAPVQPAASSPVVAIARLSHRGRRAVVRVRVSGVSVVEVSASGAPRKARRLVGSGVHTFSVPLVRRDARARPGRHRIDVVAVDGAGRRSAASGEIVVLGNPLRIGRGVV